MNKFYYFHHNAAQRDIAGKIKVSEGTVTKNLSYLREQAKINIKSYIDEKTKKLC